MIRHNRKTGAVFCALLLSASAAMAAEYGVPETPVSPVTNSYFGRQVVDNYQWLEKQQSPEVVAWMKAQAAATREALDSMPGRARLSAEMQRYLDAQATTISNVKIAGDLLFYRKRARGVNQETLYVRPAAGGSELALLDMNTVSKPGQHAAMNDYTPSADGRMVEVTISMGGDEVGVGRFYDTTTGKLLPDRITHVVGAFGFDADAADLLLRRAAGAAAEQPTHREVALPAGTRPRAGYRGQGRSDRARAWRGRRGRGAGAELSGRLPCAERAFRPGDGAAGRGSEYCRLSGTVSALKTHQGWRRVAGTADKITDAYVRGKDLVPGQFPRCAQRQAAAAGCGPSGPGQRPKWWWHPAIRY